MKVKYQSPEILTVSTMSCESGFMAVASPTAKETVTDKTMESDEFEGTKRNLWFDNDDE